MSKEYLQGRDMLLFLVNKSGDKATFTCIGAAFDASFSLSHAITPTAPLDDWRWETHVAGVQSWEVQSTHYVRFFDSPTLEQTYAHSDLLDIFGDGSRLVLFCTAISSDEPTNAFGRRPRLNLNYAADPDARMRLGYASLTSYTENAPRDGVVSASITLRGNGALMTTPDEITAFLGEVINPTGEWREHELWNDGDFWIEY